MNNDIYELLRKDIQRKVGQIRYGRDCTRLSEQLKKETGRQISNSTLKRFFGIVKSPFQTSKYTLETLVQFLGFDDWYDYVNTFDQSKHQNGNLGSWDNLRKRIMIVTNHSLESLKQKALDDSEKVLSRKFAEKKLHGFMESEKAVTMLVAPDGYGKSTSVIQIVENYFLNPDAPYKNDIVFLIDGGIFFNLYSKNSNINLLSQLLEYNAGSGLEQYFQRNPDELKGRILMIIDNVDEIFFDRNKYHNFIENLMRLIMGNDNGWYKTLLTCRPENLDAFIYQIKKNPILKNSWFDMDFDNNNFKDQINVPLLNKDEINELLKMHGFEYDCNYLEQTTQKRFIYH